MKVRNHQFLSLVIGASVALSGVAPVSAQEILPEDNGLYDYHRGPEWRESESHPLRIAAYILHPIGWVAREVIFRPLSYFASSTPETRSVMGYRHPHDYRQPTCFSASNETPNCRSIAPFNYAESSARRESPEGSLHEAAAPAEISFPSVNFDFDKSTLNETGKARAREVAALLQSNGYIQGQFRIVIEGHTDDVGSPAYNERLGLRRAESVKSALAAEGIAGSRMSTVTFGETQPLSNDKTPEGRALNRRVEVRVK